MNENISVTEFKSILLVLKMTDCRKDQKSLKKIDGEGKKEKN
jgi:hypothetical protein